jgi:hypothetical protein
LARTFPGEYDLICIDEVRERIIGFVVLEIAPVRYVPMRCWFHRESATTVAVRLNPTNDWNLHHIQFAGKELFWTSSTGRLFTLNQVQPDQLPSWWDARLAAQNLKMDGAERVTGPQGGS